jgi:hypothetical protein
LNSTDPNLDHFAVKTSPPSRPSTQIHLGQVVQGVNTVPIGHLGPSDTLEQPLKVIWASLSCLQKVNPLFNCLTKTKSQINSLSQHLEVINRWMAHPKHQTSTSANTWSQLERNVTSKL